VTLSPGLNVIDESDGSLVHLKAEDSDISWNFKKLVLYHCNESECKQTFGYLRDSKNQYYVLPKSGDKKEVEASETCTIGGWYTDNKLCLDGTDAVGFTTGVSTIETYVLKTGKLPAGNVFNNEETADLSAGPIVVEVSSNAIVLNNLYFCKFFF